jgi:hypothetical protein
LVVVMSLTNDAASAKEYKLARSIFDSASFLFLEIFAIVFQLMVKKELGLLLLAPLI